MIKDFNFYAPTRVVFGKNAEMQIGDLVAQQNGHKVLVHYGGGSAERSGLLGVVREQLKSNEIPFVELGGVVPNPLLSKVQEGISLCRREQVDFILAVGGGSVIDSAKAIGYGSLYDGDVWDFWAGKACCRQRDVVQLRHYQGRRTHQARHQQRPLPLPLCRHESRTHLYASSLPDGCWGYRHHDAHHGALFFKIRGHDAH